MSVYASSVSSSSTSARPYIIHPENRQSQLLTPVSCFPSRMLPPPGAAPRLLTTRADKQLTPIGASVEVRRFNVRQGKWMPWIPGTVVGHHIERFHAGTEVDIYDVQTTNRACSTESFIPFLGELRDGHFFNPSDSAQDMLDRITEMKKVFACVPVRDSKGSLINAWLPAIVINKRSDPFPFVHILAGPSVHGKERVPAPHILPYTMETAEAIRKSGQAIVFENGAF